MVQSAASLFGCAILPLVAIIILAFLPDSYCEPRPQTLSLINPFTGAALFSTSLASAQSAAALGLLGGGLALGAVALAAAAAASSGGQGGSGGGGGGGYGGGGGGRRRGGGRGGGGGSRSRGRGNRGYGKRSTNTDIIGEVDSVTRKIVDLFHRASQIDEEQCVSRLICEVNANSDDAKSQMERLILLSFGDNDAKSSPYPEFDRAAQVGRGRSRDKCRSVFSRCGLSSEDLRFEAMNSL